MIRVLIVEDDEMAGTLFAGYIVNKEGYELAGTVESAGMAELYCIQGRVDLILMDVCTGMGASGIEVAGKLKKDYPDIRIVIMTSQPEADFIDRARAAGVESFWYKTPKEQELFSIMEETMEGKHIWPKESPRVEVGNIDGSELTLAERRVLRELITGDSDAEIAERLQLSTSTVKTHIRNILRKTGFKSRTQLAVVASKSGLIINEY